MCTFLHILGLIVWCFRCLSSSSSSQTQRSQQPPFSPSQPLSPDVALPFNNLDPFAAKQMAALQATSIAKAGNRSAPGGVTSASYFGGLSTHQSSRPEATPIVEANGHFSFSSPPGIQGQGPPSNVSTPTLPFWARNLISTPCYTAS